MSIKSKVLAAAATLTLVSGVGVTGALTAGSAAAATPSCGNFCINTFNRDFPPVGFQGGPASPIDVFRQSEKVGNPIILFRSSNFDPALDWTQSFQGTVADFFAAGLVSSAVALHYGCISAIFPGGSCQDAKGLFPNLSAFEMEYAPFGVDSGLCMGVAAAAFQGEGVTLQPCGVSSKTVWIIDSPPSFDAIFSFPGVPLINGSDTNFSHPFVLTYPAGANPVDKPRAQVTVTNLTGFSNPVGGFPIISTISSSQLWLQTRGQLP
jgi:hypothetical protein